MKERVFAESEYGSLMSRSIHNFKISFSLRTCHIFFVVHTLSAGFSYVINLNIIVTWLVRQMLRSVISV